MAQNILSNRNQLIVEVAKYLPIVKCNGICRGKPGSIAGHATRSNGAWHEKLTVIYTNNDGPVEITCYNTDESISASNSDYNDKPNVRILVQQPNIISPKLLLHLLWCITPNYISYNNVTVYRLRLHHR